MRRDGFLRLDNGGTVAPTGGIEHALDAGSKIAVERLWKPPYQRDPGIVYFIEPRKAGHIRARGGQSYAGLKVENVFEKTRVEAEIGRNLHDIL